MNQKTPQLEKGDRVIVRNSTLSGEPIIEGEATLVERDDCESYDGRQSWAVRFDEDEFGGGGVYTRWIDPTDIVG